MTRILRYLVQALLLTAFAVFVGYFSIAPRYEYADDSLAVLKLSLSHAANRAKPCVRLTPQEIAELPPNMRQPMKCERLRLPLIVELDVDGEAFVRIAAPPSGLWSDGQASIYERFDIEPGRHTITARLRETDREDGWDYAYTAEVELEAGRYFTVTFRAETGGFKFR